VDNVLEVRDLRVAFFTYYGVVQAVNGVSFTIAHEETLGIVGESGSGKSVTATAVMGLTQPPGAITDGAVFLHAQNLLALPEETWAQIRGNQMTMCFQNPARSLNPVLRVGYQMMRVYRRHVHSATKRKAREHAIHLLKEVNIADAERIISRYPHQLSGGMCQRVMIVMALMCDPSLLILDEPTTGLDVTVQKQLLHLLSELRTKTAASQWLITHDLGVVANLCDRVVVMYAGKVIEDASVDEIFLHPLHPYTQALLKAIPQVSTRTPLRAIPGNVPEALNLPSGCPFNPRCEYKTPVCETIPPEFTEPSNRHRVACHLYGGRGEDRE